MPEPPRRFPTPWHADKIPGGFVVRDANGQALAYLYSRENEDEARQAKVLTKDEARRIAVNFARLPGLLGKGWTRLTRNEPTDGRIRDGVSGARPNQAHPNEGRAGGLPFRARQGWR
jgi:hypothetical protein